jgi:hypothetical protein
MGAGNVDDDGGTGGSLNVEGTIGVAELRGRNGEDVQRRTRSLEHKEGRVDAGLVGAEDISRGR